jgi:hypothetical protein
MQVYPYVYVFEKATYRGITVCQIRIQVSMLPSFQLLGVTWHNSSMVQVLITLYRPPNTTYNRASVPLNRTDLNATRGCSQRNYYELYSYWSNEKMGYKEINGNALLLLLY